MLANEEQNLDRKLEEQEKENHEKYNEEIRKINDAQDATILGMQGDLQALGGDHSPDSALVGRGLRLLQPPGQGARRRFQQTPAS